MAPSAPDHIKKVIRAHGYHHLASMAVLLSSMCTPLLTTNLEQKMPWTLLEAGTDTFGGEQFSLFYVHPGFTDLGACDRDGQIAHLPKSSVEFISQQVNALCGEPPTSSSMTTSCSRAAALNLMHYQPKQLVQDSERIQQAVATQRPAILAGHWTPISEKQLAQFAESQFRDGRVFVFTCGAQDQQATNDLLPSHFFMKLGTGPRNKAVHLVTNDKTLARMFFNVPWHHDGDSFEKNLSSTSSVLSSLSDASRTLAADPSWMHQCVQKLRPGWTAVATATQDHTHFMLLSSATSSSGDRTTKPPTSLKTFPLSSVMCTSRSSTSLPRNRTSWSNTSSPWNRTSWSSTSSPRNRTSWSSTSLPWNRTSWSSGTKHIMATGNTEVENLDEEMRVEASEDQDEVQRQLKPLSSEVSQLADQLDDFKKHDEFGPFSLDPQLRREIFKIHRNLNHPARDTFIRALRNAEVKPEVLEWTKEFFKCPVCDAHPRPSPARPAHLMKALEFNAVVGIDLLYMKIFDKEETFLNILDHGTGFMMVARCADAQSRAVQEKFWDQWIKHYGNPLMILCDKGPEFFDEPFQEALAQGGTAVHFTDAASPWQNGRVERSGATFKSKLKAIIYEGAVIPEEIDQAVAQVVAAHNQLYDKAGFSPNQRVFGRSLRLPASILSDDKLDAELLQEAAGDTMKRSWQLRELAQREWLKAMDRSAVARSRRANLRRTDERSRNLRPGQWVFVWRRLENQPRWIGPGSLVAMAPGGTSWWVNMRGRLWKVSAEQLRPATSEENLGEALAQEVHRDLQRQLARPRRPRLPGRHRGRGARQKRRKTTTPRTPTSTRTTSSAQCPLDHPTEENTPKTQLLLHR